MKIRTTPLTLAFFLMVLPEISFSAILFDGNGDPTESGLVAINTPGEWQFDTPSAGLLYQPPTSDDGGYGLNDAEGAGVAGAELDASQGYFVELSFDLVSSSDGPGWPGYNIGTFIWLEDSAGQNIVLSGLENNTSTNENYRIHTGWSDPSEVVGTVDMSGGFHTIRLEHPGGNASTIDVFFDGSLVLDDQPMGSEGNGFARFMVGNGGANSVGEAVYDYIAINQEHGGAPPQNDLSIFWKQNTSGDWNTTSNWTGIGLPPGSNQSAVLGDVIESTQIVFTNTDVTVNDVQFNDSSTYIVGGGGVINLMAGTTDGLPTSGVSATQGFHQFQASVALQNDATADVAEGASIEFNNRLFLNGHTLTKTGDGSLAISNRVVLADGTLDVQQGILSGYGTVGGDVNNMGGTLSPGDSDSVTSAIPEPSTMLLLVLGGLLGIGLRRW